ncbi:MAG: hypothetical protein KF715_11910 [Candidatus Didemnitutus sp.]|nr:hypothetical protein [Candidatus Didemnitutus sp.]
MTEDEADAMQARSDLLNDRVQARLAREGAENYARILQEEIERLNREHPAPPPTPEQRARNQAWLEKFNSGQAGTSAGETEDDEQPHEHAWVTRLAEFLDRCRARAESENWIPEDAVPEHPVRELIHALERATVKLTVALNGRRWPPESDFVALTIPPLKKVREYLDDALRAAESCEEEALLDPAQLSAILRDAGEIAQQIDARIAELRAKLERGAR